MPRPGATQLGPNYGPAGGCGCPAVSTRRLKRRFLVSEGDGYPTPAGDSEQPRVVALKVGVQVPSVTPRRRPGLLDEVHRKSASRHLPDTYRRRTFGSVAVPTRPQRRISKAHLVAALAVQG